MARPVVLIVFAFACGIIGEAAVGRGYACGTYLACAAVLYLCACLLRRRSLFVVIVALCFVAAGAGSAALEQCVSPSHISNFYLDTARLSMYAIEGTVVDIGTPGNRRCVLRLERIASGAVTHPCSGTIEVVPVPDSALSCGQRVLVRGEVIRQYPFRYHRFGMRRTPRFTVTSRPPGGVRVLGHPAWYSLSGLRGRLKWKIAHVSRGYLSPLSADVLAALLLGERADFPGVVTESLKRTGTIHILSISGFHVGLIAYLLKELFKIIRIPRRGRIVLTVPVLLFYCSLTGASSPAARSTLMAIMFLAAYALRKEPDLLNALAVSGLVLLGISPSDLFTASFQLSFASVFSIGLIYPRLLALFPEAWVKKGVSAVVLRGFTVSLSAWLGTAAIVAYLLRIVTPVALIANLAVVPLSAALMYASIVFVAAAFLLPCAAAPCAASVEAATALLLHVNALFASLPGAYFYLPGAR